MYCPYKENTSTDKSLTLIFDAAQILYDIENDAWIQADVIKAEDPHDKHQIADIVEEGNIDHVARVMDLAYGEVTDFLFPFAKNAACDGEVMDNALRRKNKFTMELTVPEAFPKSSETRLTNLIHNYFVYRVIQDWCTLVQPELAEGWMTKLTACIDDIKKTANRRTERVRIKQHPSW